MPLYSYSRIGCFENCPRQYKFKYIEKPPIEKTEGVEAYMGKTVHEALEQCYKMAMNERLLELEELLEVYNRIWNEKMPEKINIVDTKMKLDDYFKVGSKALEMFYKRYYPFDQEITIGLERNINFSLDDEGRYKLIGFIDRLSRDNSGRLRIQDYKTNKRLPTQGEIDRETQLALYQIAVDQMWPDNNGIELVWHFLRYDTALISHRSPEQLDDLKDAYIEKIKCIEKAVELRDFPTNETNLCDWCEYNKLCPAKGGEGVVDSDQQKIIFVSEEEKTKLIDEYIELDAQIKILSKRQKGVKAEILGLGESGEDKLIMGTGASGVMISLRNVEKLPTKSFDSDKYNLIREMLIDSGLYEKYSAVDTRLLQKDFAKCKFPEETQSKLSGFSEKTTTGTIRIKKSKR